MQVFTAQAATDNEFLGRIEFHCIFTYNSTKIGCFLDVTNFAGVAVGSVNAMRVGSALTVFNRTAVLPNGLYTVSLFVIFPNGSHQSSRLEPQYVTISNSPYASPTTCKLAASYNNYSESLFH